MRKFSITAAFGFVGLVNTWLCLWILAKIDLSSLRAPSTNECGDLGQCDMSFASIAKLLLLLFLPTIVHLIFGYIVSKKNTPSAQRVYKALSVLALITMLFYLSVSLLV